MGQPELRLGRGCCASANQPLTVGSHDTWWNIEVRDVRIAVKHKTTSKKLSEFSNTPLNRFRKTCPEQSKQKKYLKRENPRAQVFEGNKWESIPVPGVAVALVHEQDIIYFILYVEGVQRHRLV